MAAILLLLVVLTVTWRHPQVLSPKGYGMVRFGTTTLSDMEKKLGEQAEPPAWQRDPDCDFVIFAAYPAVSFMVQDGIVTRADAEDVIVPNSIGIKVGTTLEEVLKRFPSVVVEDHAYVDGHYLIFRSKDGNRAVVFEEVEGKITCVRAGLKPSVEYIEGCQ
ncbi:MAG: hypothetical protein O3C69_05900 [Chloroflexi bacterium]|nr:hypothetical protein [Chloroflexota bacterium]